MQNATKNQTVGSGYADKVDISYSELVGALGEPNDCKTEGEWYSGDGKVQAEWAFIFPELEDTVITIYDYKEHWPVEKVTDWHIGAKGKRDNVEKAISILMETVANYLMEQSEHELNDTTMTLEHKKYLDELRESGITNMFGAGPYLEKEFGLGKKEALTILTEWMRTFKEVK